MRSDNLPDFGGFPGTAETPDFSSAFGGARMYYNDGFLSAGGAQTDSFWSQLPNLVSTAITAFQPRSGGFGQPPAPLPPVQTVPSTHPVIGVAGQSGTPAPPYYIARPGGRMGRYAPAGTRGYHPPKHAGKCSQTPAGMWVRNRHRNVCNPRALRRAISRAHGFAKLAMKTIHLIHPKKKGRFGGFRRKRATR